MSGTSDKPGRWPELGVGQPAARSGSSDSNAQIAFKLKSLYNAVEQEPIPDIFLDLLEKLDRAEQLGEPEA